MVSSRRRPTRVMRRRTQRNADSDGTARRRIRNISMERRTDCAHHEVVDEVVEREIFGECICV